MLKIIEVHKQNTHCDDRRYTCKECNKKFKDSSNFSKHKKTHINEKSWKCVECPESFVRRDQLFRHASRVHGTEAETREKLCKGLFVYYVLYAPLSRCQILQCTLRI